MADFTQFYSYIIFPIELLVLISRFCLATKLILEELREYDRYPSNSGEYSTLPGKSLDDLLDELPPLLKCFTEKIVRTKVKKSPKVLSIAHCILLLAAAKPGTLLSPVQLGLAVTMHHHFQSRYLNDLLASFGFAESYGQAEGFEKSAALLQSSAIIKAGTSFCQFLADNADDNPDTLDGKNSVHAMGIIAAITPGIMNNQITIKKQNPTTAQLLSLSTGNIKECSIKEARFLKNVRFQDIFQNIPSFSHTKIDLLYITSKAMGSNLPNWRGTMQAMSRGVHPKPSSFHFCHLLTLNPAAWIAFTQPCCL